MSGAKAPEPGNLAGPGGTGAEAPAEAVRDEAPISSPLVPANWGKGKRFLAVGETTLSSLLPLEGAEVHPLQAEDALDDATWAPEFARIRKGHYAGVVWNLPADTYSVTLRSADRPHGLQKLPPPDKERVRAANELARRVLEVAMVAKSRRMPWWVTGPNPAGGIGPRNLKAWKQWEATDPVMTNGSGGFGQLHGGEERPEQGLLAAPPR